MISIADLVSVDTKINMGMIANNFCTVFFKRTFSILFLLHLTSTIWGQSAEITQAEYLGGSGEDIVSNVVSNSDCTETTIIRTTSEDFPVTDGSTYAQVEPEIVWNSSVGAYDTIAWYDYVEVVRDANGTITSSGYLGLNPVPVEDFTMTRCGGNIYKAERFQPGSNYPTSTDGSTPNSTAVNAFVSVTDESTGTLLYGTWFETRNFGNAWTIDVDEFCNFSVHIMGVESGYTTTNGSTESINTSTGMPATYNTLLAHWDSSNTLMYSTFLDFPAPLIGSISNVFTANGYTYNHFGYNSVFGKNYLLIVVDDTGNQVFTDLAPHGYTGFSPSVETIETQNGIIAFPTNGDGIQDVKAYEYNNISNSIINSFLYTVGGTPANRKKALTMQCDDGSTVFYFEEHADATMVTTDGTTAGGEDGIIIKMNDQFELVYATIINSGASGVDDIDAINCAGNGDIVVTGTISNNVFETTDGSVVEATPTNPQQYVRKYGANGRLLFSTVMPADMTFSTATQDFVTDVPNSNIYFCDGKIVVNGWTADADHYTTDAGNALNNTDNYRIVYDLCPSLDEMGGDDVVSPASQEVCMNAFIGQIEAPDLMISSSGLTPIYQEGVAVSQNDFLSSNYQWQIADSPSGPWTDIAGAIFKNHSPEPIVEDKYYRRVAYPSECCGDNPTPISTSTVAEVLVNSNTAPTVDAGGVFITCPGIPVTLNSTISAETSGYTIDWDNGADDVEDPTVTVTESTVFTLYVTDDNGCEQLDQAIVTVYQADAGVDVMGAVCAGSPIRIGGTPIQGVTGIQYAWSPADGLSCTDCAQPLASPSASTTYTLTLTVPITGGGTCETTDDIIVNVVDGPGVDFAGPDVVICKGETASIGEAAVDGFSYTWAPGNYLTDNLTTPTTFQPGGLDFPTPNPILYYLTAEKDGCTFVDDMLATVIEADAGLDGCGPRSIGTFDETPNIEETYLWTRISGDGSITGPTNTATTTVSASIAGPTTYQLDVTYNGYTCTDQVIVPPDCGCGVSIDVVSPFECPLVDNSVGATVSLFAVGGVPLTDPSSLIYTWSVVSGPPGGLDTTDGPVVNLTDEIERTFRVTLTSTENADVMCSEEISVNNPAWSLPVFDAPDVSTCSSVPVSIGQPPVADYTYDWSPWFRVDNRSISMPTATVANTTEFSVTVTDTRSGCVVKDTLVVTTAAVADAGPDRTVCDNGVITIGTPGVPGATYEWSPASANWQNGTDQNSAMPEVLVATDQMFTLTVTDNGCESTDEVMVIVSESIEPFTLPNIMYCPSDGPVTLGPAPDGFAQYSWSPTTALTSPQDMPSPMTTDPPPTMETTFDLTVSNADGCTFVATQTIIPVTEDPNAGANQTICVDETILIGDADNPEAADLSYLWTGDDVSLLSSATSPNPTFTAQEPGIYEYTLTKTMGGCSNTDVITITVNEYNLPNFSTTVNACSGASVVIGPDPELTVEYLWTPSTFLSDPTVAMPMVVGISGSQTYTLVATGPNGCTDVTTVNVVVSDAEAANVTIDPVAACIGESGVSFSPVVTPVGDYNYEWRPNDGSVVNRYDPNSEILLFGLGTKMYYLDVVNNANGCLTTQTVTLSVESCPECVIPEATLVGVEGGCSNDDDASISISAAMNANQANYSIGTTYSGPNYNGTGAIDISGGVGSVTGLSYNTEYTIRIFNGNSSCFMDYALTVPNTTVSQATLTATEGTCSDITPNDDASISISGVMNADVANYSTGATYSGPDYNGSGAIDISGGSGMITGLMHNTEYTIRIFNGSNDCFVDYMVTTSSIDCNATSGDCGCTDYLYLAEPVDGTVHKFVLDGTFPAPEIGSPWYGGTEFPKPHGIAVDLNGFLYIGEVAINGDDTNIRKVTCDGTVFPDTEFHVDDFANNMQSIGNTLYVAGGGISGIRAYDLCTGELIGTACTSVYSWELDYNKVTDTFTWGHQLTGAIYVASLSELNAAIASGTCLDAPLIPAATGGQTSYNVGDNFVIQIDNNSDFPGGNNCYSWGITSDNQGNIYQLQTCIGGEYTKLLKWDSTGGYVTETPVATTANGAGFAGALGIRYHDATDLLYLSNWPASSDCVSGWNTDLDMYTTVVPPNGQSGFGSGKAINIITECCPTQSNLNYSEQVCSEGNGEKVFLQDVFSCGDGIVCEGTWTVETPNENQVFNDCDLSITVNGDGCGMYVFEKTTAATGNQQCDPFRIEVEICTVVPEVTLSSIEGTCSGSTNNDDASISISDVMNADEANYSLGTIYSGPDYNGSGAIDISGGSALITDLIHNTEYTIRIFNGSNDCFVDYYITTSELTCCEVDAISLISNQCVDNSTTGDPSDDRVQVGISITGTGSSFTLSVDGSTTITPSSGTFGSPGLFLLGPGTAGSGNTYTITIEDAGDPSCNQTLVIQAPENCESVFPCPTVDCGGVTVQKNE